MISTSANTLTEIEACGLKSECNMADGHAYHDLQPAQLTIVKNLPELWEIAQAKKHHQAELDFRDSFLTLARCPSLAQHFAFKICPTASNSIDTLGTWLKDRRLETWLIEPTFDNLSLILKRRGARVKAVSEQNVLSMLRTPLLKKPGALFIVNPNNPTGKSLSENEFLEIAAWCRANDIVLLLDNTFRFFLPQAYDTYKILKETKVSFVSIEDTGKVWPTQDLKASLIFFSPDIAKEIEIIYEEIYLCVSNFQLEVLGQFMNDAYRRGLDEAVWSEVSSRRAKFRETIHSTFLEIEPNSFDSKISVEWVRIKDFAYDDFRVMKSLMSRNLAVLPGRHFYWQSSEARSSQRNLRFSLLKRRVEFERSLRVLKEILMETT